MRYRYIATFEAEPNECFTQEVQEKLKNRIKEEIELQCGNNVFVTLEDEYCIKRNDTIGESIVGNCEDFCYKESYIKSIVSGLDKNKKSSVFYIQKDEDGNFEYAHFITALYFSTDK